MDPAQPDFENHPMPIRLDENDAIFVDAIHTNGAPLSSGGAGLMQQVGDVDFYVNGGETQPSCPSAIGGALSHIGELFSGNIKGISEAVSCSHGRSHEYFTESINSPCPFTAYPCDTYSAHTITNSEQSPFIPPSYHSRVLSVYLPIKTESVHSTFSSHKSPFTPPSHHKRARSLHLPITAEQYTSFSLSFEVAESILRAVLAL
ncbi:hypothetical protein CHS0354_042085 [Potamilus streckersoni]|uniref:Lipase domain-containing protein n=1 Tax=Potamilus streckersoni TaxID=2493646 RepID=A0AAE0WGE9_9BIVA|nr:hypothetical protein CHS0354_042085 [Potamilus streckersoni]